MSYGLIATLIVLAIVIGAITTKKCEAFLIAGSMVGAIVLWKQDFLTKWVWTKAALASATSARLVRLSGFRSACHQTDYLVLSV